MPAQMIDKGKGKAAARTAAEARRKAAALRRTLAAMGDVGNVQFRFEYRTSPSGRLVLLKPAQLREARRLLRGVAPAGASQTVQGTMAPKGKRPATTAQYVLRVTFV